MEYTKPWLSIDEQVGRLVERGLAVADRRDAAELLQEVGYYRLTGYLHPFRESTAFHDEHGRSRVRVLDRYEAGTRLAQAEGLIDFDRKLRLLVLEGVERIEVALRTQLGHSIGEFSAFAHEDRAVFVSSFTEPRFDGGGERLPSRHEAWLQRAEDRRNSSDEAFVRHFRATYDGRMPIWALTEILELGQVSRLYGGLRNDIATEIAVRWGVPTKRLLQSWIASVNYVRNVAAHHARLFNRKLVVAPKRPSPADVPLLAHLTQKDAPKEFGTYSTLAVMACLLEEVHPGRDWALRAAELLRAFPATGRVTVESVGVREAWLDEDLWRKEDPSVSR